jgi:outer membrane protein TolC
MNLAIVALLAQLTVRGSAGETVQTPPPAPAEATVPLPVLVAAALDHNLTLKSALAGTCSVETGVQAAKSAFDPAFELSPLFARPEMQLLSAPGVILSGTQPNGQFSTGLSGLLPSSTRYSISLDSNWLRQSNPQLLAPGQLTPSVNSTLSFSVAQPLLRGRGRSFAEAPVNLARFASQSARERFGRTVEQTIANVESAYWSLGFAEANERLSRDSYGRARELMARNEKMRELNLISEVDAITSRRGVQQRLTTLTEAVRLRQDAVERLIYLVYGQNAAGRLTDEPVLRTEPPPSDYPQPPPMADLEEHALRARRDFEAAKLDLSQREILTRLAKNSLQPDARLTASYSAQTLGTDRFRLFSTSRPGDFEQTDWSVGVSFNYPLWNRASRAAYARARYDADAQAAALASTEVVVRGEVRSAARAIEADGERLAQAQLSFTLAKQQYEAGQKQLQLGLIDSFRLLQMEEDLANAELVLEQIRYELALAFSSFELAMGTIEQKYPSGGFNLCR